MDGWRKNRNEPGESMVCCRDNAARGFVILFWRNHGKEIFRRLFCDLVGSKPVACGVLLLLLLIITSAVPLFDSIYSKFYFVSLRAFHFDTRFTSNRFNDLWLHWNCITILWGRIDRSSDSTLHSFIIYMSTVNAVMWPFLALLSSVFLHV